MQFEILNTIQYFVLLVLTGIGYGYAKKYYPILSWKPYFVLVLVVTLLSYQQFFTLTEKTDTEATQATMLMQAGSIKNSKTVRNYLEDTKEVVTISAAEKTKALLLEQQKLSKALAKEIEKQNKENK